MFLLDWLYSFLSLLGFYKKQATILLLGLDNAGKTTLLYKLKTGKISNFIPTARAHVEEITLGKINFKAWDLGGHARVRVLWTDYFVETDAVVFVIDSADSDRFNEAKEELFALLTDKVLQSIPFLILGNKSDIKTSLSCEELINSLNLNKLSEENCKRQLEVFKCSVIEGTGYTEAFQWLSGVLS